MVRKTDSPNTRRNHFLYRAGKSEPGKSYVEHFTQETRELAKEPLFRIALHLDPDAQDISSKALRKAFETFKLDPNDPLDWRQLINTLAYVQFGERPKKARKDPKKWTSANTGLLRSEIKPLGGLSNKLASLRLTKDKKSTFFGWGVSGLEKKIAEIRRAE
jgi:hypothetical protein